MHGCFKGIWGAWEGGDYTTKTPGKDHVCNKFSDGDLRYLILGTFSRSRRISGCIADV